MKPIIPSTLLAALLAVGAAHAAATDPVGYVSLGDTTVGQPAIKGGTDVAVAIPLDKPAAFAGTISGTPAGNVITVTGTPGFGSFTTTPHVAKIEGGARSGLVGLITANTANSVTITIPAGDNLTGVVNGDAITIRPAWTVLGVMGTAVPIGTQVLAFSGTTPGINISADLVYEFNGTYWEDGFSLEDANNAVLYTGESFVVRNPTATPIASLVVSGEVPTSASRVVVSKIIAPAGQDNRVSYVSPVNEPVGTSNLSSFAVIGDQIFGFNNNVAGLNKSAAVIAEWNGTYWEDAFSLEDVSATFMLNGGQGYVVRRATSAPVGDQVWSDVPTYVPNL